MYPTFGIDLAFSEEFVIFHEVYHFVTLFVPSADAPSVYCFA
jgi:hypothetical protein